jgi:hypothetical protein
MVLFSGRYMVPFFLTQEMQASFGTNKKAKLKTKD